MKKLTLLFLLCFGIYSTSFCQFEENLPTPTATPIQPNQKFELGLHAGHFFINGNVNFTPSFGAGFHLRKALDYVFSIRLDAIYGKAMGEDAGNTRNFDNIYFAGSIQTIASLNNLKWREGNRNSDFYLFAGLGLNSFETTLTENDNVVKFKEDISPHFDLGFGISFRMNKRINIGLEHKFTSLLNKHADQLDGVITVQNTDNNRNVVRDILNYSSIRLNFNLGKGEDEDEPLYWVNPLITVLKDMESLKEGQIDLTDTDEDGIIDILDDEEYSSRGAIVNTRGVTIDSDNDGYPDHRDREPYSPLGYKINKRGVSQTPDIQEEVRRYVAEELKNFTPPSSSANIQSVPTEAPEIETDKPEPLTNWYLPTIYFTSGRHTISSKDFGTLANIANLIKANPKVKIAVIGHTDEVSTDFLNNELSYKRAKNTINYLVRSHKIPRERLVLQWKGEKENLVQGSNLVNRRVEFRVAMEEDMEMDVPKE